MSQTPISAAVDPTPAWERFLENNFKTLLKVFGLIVIGVCVYGYVNYSNKMKALQAGEAFSAASTVEDLDRVIQEHAGSVAAGSALLKKADMLWEQNKKTSSVDALKEFVAKHSDHPFYAQTLLALGAKQESLGNRSEAKPLFERLVSEFPKSDVAALAELRLGDLLWAEGKEADAKKIYEGVAVKFPGTDNEILNQGEVRTKWIAAKLPTKEVDGPPKPKEPAAPAPTPGMPQFKLNATNATGGISPTIAPSPPGASASPVINLTPGGATSAPITVTPGANMPAPPAVKVPVPAVSAPVAPKPAPAPAATTAPAPVKPAATPAPSAAPAPAMKAP